VTRTLRATEHQEQSAFMAWWLIYAQQRRIHPSLCFAIPNGGKRGKITAALLKAEGVRAGIPDVMLAIPRGGFHGLYLEFKRAPNKPSVEQEAMLYELRRQGYNALVVYGATEAVGVVRAYLGANP